MTGAWFASYLILWALVLVLCLCLIAILRQLGLVYRQLELPLPQLQEHGTIPTLENDGPAIGSPIVNFEADTINGFGSLAIARQPDSGTTLLMFMSPMCEACQHIVEPLNTVVAGAKPTIHSTVIMRADEQACRAFLSVFPLHMPVVCDSDRTITMGLEIHRTPFGLLYDEQGILIRKGLVEGHDDLLALFGDESAPLAAQTHVFPHLMPSHI